MIALLIQQDQIQIEMRGSEDKILEELSTAIVRMMKAMEESHEENTYFV